jgi:hypothetical protein
MTCRVLMQLLLMQLGVTIADKIFPNAIQYFMGVWSGEDEDVLDECEECDD